MVILLGQSNRMASRDIAKQVRPLIGLNERQAAANLNYREKVYNKYREQGMGEVKARERADKAAIKYAGKQHRFRAETIVHTELAFAYNRGAHMGVGQAIAEGYMGRCAMKWSTAGTNRVCSRCLALKDTIVGYTDESGVTLPPLHPRCRCAIIYDEDLGRDKKKKPNKPSNNISGAGKPLTPAQIKEIRDAEDAAYNAKTGADFGFKMREHNSIVNWANEIRFANGDIKSFGRQINCQRCVVAHEARMRGYDVIARPSWGDDDTLSKIGNWLEVFAEEDKKIYNCKGTTVAEIKNFIAGKLKEWGVGSRAFVWFKWNDFTDGAGHVIVAQLNEKEFVQYGDPQKRKIGAEDSLNAIKIGTAKLMRVDNLEFTNAVKRCCMNKV